jgi:hypothetical protein
VFKPSNIIYEREDAWKRNKLSSFSHYFVVFVATDKTVS